MAKKKSLVDALGALGWVVEEHPEGAVPGATAQLGPSPSVVITGDSLASVVEQCEGWERGQAARKPEAQHPYVAGRK
jgi:hypothetical protein